MNIVVRLGCGINYAVDTYDIDGRFIELRRPSASGKPQLTTLPIEDVQDIQLQSIGDRSMHSIGNFGRIESRG
jgi:hypothetical protein